MRFQYPLLNIPNGFIKTPMLAPGAVTTPVIADDAVTALKVAAGAIGNPELAANAVTSGNIADLAVISGKIANAAVGNSQLAWLAVATANIVDAAVATAKIADGAVATTKIANAAITNALIANLAVGTANIQTAAITNALIANLAVGTANIQDLAVTSAKINSLTADKITAGTITATIEMVAATITGGLVRTAASGRRIQMGGGALDIEFYSGSGSELVPGFLRVNVDGSLQIFAPAMGAGSPGMTFATIGTDRWATFAFDRMAFPAPVWHYIGASGEPAFQNSWANFVGGFGLAAYTVDPDGTVRLAGTLTGGTINAAAWTLPAGARPSVRKAFVAVVGGLLSRVDVDTSGNVLIGTINSPPAGSYVCLDGMSFSTS